MVNQSRALIFIFLTVMIDVIGFGIIIPVFPRLIEELTGKGLSQASAWAGMLMVSFAVMQFLFSPVMGELSDRYGRRPILLLSLLGLSLDYLLHAFATTIAWLFIGRIFAGICGASFTTANAYIADISNEEDRAKNFGLIGAAFGLGFIIGPAIGGLLGDVATRLPFYVAAGLSFANFLFGYFFVPESLSPDLRRQPSLKKMIPGVSLQHLSTYKGLGLLIVALFLANVAGQVLPAIWSFFTMEVYTWDEMDVGLSLTFVGLLVAIVQGGLLGRIVKTFGEHKTILGGFILWSIGMTLFAFAVEGWMIYLILIPYALGGVAGPTLQGLLSKNVNDREQGNLQGALASMLSITTIIGPAIATTLFFRFTQEVYFPGAPYIVSAILLLISTVCVYCGLIHLKDIQSNREK